MSTILQRFKVYAVLGAIALGVVTAHTILVSPPGEDALATFPECSDSIDNDVDGLFDFPEDPDCDSMHDDTEGEEGREVFVGLSDGVAEIYQGESPVYTVSLRTDKTVPQMMDVRFYLPHYSTFLSASESGKIEGAYVRWRNVVVDPYSVKELYVTLDLHKDARVGEILFAEASALGVRAADTTLIIKKNQEGLPALEISVNDGKVFAEPGEILNYEIIVDNHFGPDRTFDLNTNLPPQLVFLGATGGEGFKQDQRSLVWNDEFVAAGEKVVFNVDAEITRDAPEFTSMHTKVAAGVAIGSDATTVLYEKIPPRALSVRVSDGYTTATVGQELRYEIVIKNNQSKLLTGIDVTNNLPTYMEFVSATEGGYWSGKDVHWAGLTVSPFGSRTLYVTHRVRSDAPLGARLNNIVSVMGQKAVDISEVSTVSIGIGTTEQVGKMMLRKVADRQEVRPGDTVVFTIILKNNQKNEIRNVRVEDRMNGSYASVIDGQAGQMIGDRLVWEIPVLSPQEMWEVRYTVRISDTTPHGTIITNVVTATGEGMETISLTERIFAGRIGVMSKLPPAGAPLDILFATILAIAGAIPTYFMRRKGILPLG